MSRPPPSVSIPMDGSLRPLHRSGANVDGDDDDDDDDDDLADAPRARLRVGRPLTAEGVAAGVVAELIARAQPVPTSELAEMSRGRYLVTQCFSLIISLLAVAAVLALTLSSNTETVQFIVALINATRTSLRPPDLDPDLDPDNSTL
jgi:hypothetical protein